MRRSDKVTINLNEMTGEVEFIDVAMTSTAQVVKGLRRTKNNLNLADLYPNSQPAEPGTVTVIAQLSNTIVRANPKPQQECIDFAPPATLNPSDDEDEDEIITPPSALAEKMRSSPVLPATPSVKSEAEDTVIIREQADNAPVKSKKTSILEATLRQSKKSREKLDAIKAEIAKDPEARFSHSGPIAIPARPIPAESDEKCFLASRSDSPKWRTNVYDSHVPHTANFRK